MRFGSVSFGLHLGIEDICILGVSYALGASRSAFIWGVKVFVSWGCHALWQHLICALGAGDLCVDPLCERCVVPLWEREAFASRGCHVLWERPIQPSSGNGRCLHPGGALGAFDLRSGGERPLQ